MIIPHKDYIDGSALWWNESPNNVAKAVFETATYLVQAQAPRRAASLHHLRVYSNRLAQSLSGSAFSMVSDVGSAERIKFPVTKAAIDAVTAQIATNQPKPQRTTIKGDYALRERAEKLDRYTMGWFYDLQIYLVALQVFVDAAIDGTGMLKFVARNNGKVGCERVRAEEILVDENECRIVVPGVTPRFMMQIRDVPRSSLLAVYKKAAAQEAIKKAEYLERMHMGYAPVEDLVTIVESWKLPDPNIRGAKGRHVISLSNKALLDEPWEFGFPFAVFRWNDAPIGFFGIGGVEEILPIQIELNYLAQKIQRLMHFATSMIFKEKGSSIGKLTNEDFAVYEYTKTPPQFANVQAVSGEYFGQQDRLYTRAFEMIGVAQMHATGQKPPGLYSGEAIRLYHDVASRRFAHTEKRYAQFFVDCAEQIADRSREIVSRGYGTSEILAAGDKGLEILKWNDVKMDRNRYQMQIAPVSIIPSTPAGKVELITALAPVVPGLAPYLLGAVSGIADLEHAVERANAPLAYAEKLVSNIIQDGVYEPPAPYADTMTILDVAQRELLNAESEGTLEPERVSLLRRLVIDTHYMMQGPGAAMMGAAPIGGMGGAMQPGIQMPGSVNATGVQGGAQQLTPGGGPGGQDLGKALSSLHNVNR